MTVPGSWYGYPSKLLVIGTAPGWLDVRLAQRPNGSTAWMPARAATLSTTPYKLVLSLSAMHIEVFLNGQEFGDFPGGIGAPDDPTVLGNYFITMTVPPPDPGYGPSVLVTSAHSDAIADWEGTGDAIIAIHGPIDAYDDTLIDTTGVQISHGSIRLHDADLAQLAPVPPGTRLDIVPCGGSVSALAASYPPKRFRLDSILTRSRIRTASRPSPRPWSRHRHCLPPPRVLLCSAAHRASHPRGSRSRQRSRRARPRPASQAPQSRHGGVGCPGPAGGCSAAW